MNYNNIGISVLIPLYNGVEYLEESVNSVVNQTHNIWEIIIGINGHPQDSEIEKKAKEVRSKYTGKDIKVMYFNTIGKPNTLNAMVENASYIYIAILDVDDKWLPTKLEKQIPYLFSYDIVGTKCKYFGDRNDSPPIPVGDLTRSNFNFFVGNPIINSSAIIKRNDAKWNNVFVDDYDMWLRLYCEKKTFYNIDEILCEHRIHKESAFNNKNNNYVNEIRIKWLKYMADKKK